MRKFETLKFAHWLVFLVGIAATLLVWETGRREARKAAQEEFDFRVNQVVSRIERRIQDARMILHATTGLFHASNDVTRKEYQAYIDSLQLPRNYPGILSVAVTRLVPAKEKAHFEQAARKDGWPNFRIWPEGERDHYAPVLFLEPMTDKGRKVLGFDLMSETVRRAAMEVARDNGDSAMTDAVTMVAHDADRSRHGFLVFAPVYRIGKPRETVEQRRANLTGWVHLAFNMDDMVQGMMRDIRGNLQENCDLRIFLGDRRDDRHLIYAGQPADATRADGGGAKFSFTRQLELSGKTLTVAMHSTPEFEARAQDGGSKTILIFGLVSSILVSALFWQLVHGRMRAIRLARRMNYVLIDREKRYRQMFEDNASIAYMLDPDTGMIIDANAAASAFWGYSPDELREMNIADINLSPTEEIQEGLQSQAEAGSAGQYYYQHRLKNGDIRDVEIYRTVLSHQGRTYIHCITHDITHRRQAEMALRESQAKLHAIIETALDAVVQMDEQGVVIDWNTRAEKTFGWTRAEAVGQPLIGLIIPGPLHEAYREGMQRFVEGDEGAVRHSQFEIDALNKAGGELTIEVAMTTLISEGGKVEYCAFMHDISDRKRTELALRRARTDLENRVFERTAELVRTNRRLNAEIAERTSAQEALQQSQEMLRQLVVHQDRIRENERRRIAREIHDELGQHLLVLRIDVSMLGKGGTEHPKLQERVDAILQQIDTTMKSVRAIINNLRPAVLDLGLYAALEWQAEEFQRRSGITCVLEADDEDLELDDSISTVVFRILQEALTNVMRHAKASRVNIKVERDNGRLTMTVADNGIGIEQAQKSDQKSFGLVGIRERLHILGGELAVHSSPSGTVLTVSLPIAEYQR